MREGAKERDRPSGGCPSIPFHSLHCLNYHAATIPYFPALPLPFLGRAREERGRARRRGRGRVGRGPCAPLYSFCQLTCLPFVDI